jgi:hypothetical protein
MKIMKVMLRAYDKRAELFALVTLVMVLALGLWRNSTQPPLCFSITGIEHRHRPAVDANRKQVQGLRLPPARP